MNRSDVVVHRYEGSVRDGLGNPDPVTTQVIQNSLISAGSRMKSIIVRTAASPSIYDMQDFSAALYDREMRLLAQGATMPLFMGSLGHCIEAAVAAIGGVSALRPGDLLIYNLPYYGGTHANDVALIKPVFLADDILIGYVAVRAHWMDVGGMGGYSTNSLDVFMEGIIYPGVKLYDGGRRNEDIFRVIMANTRVPARVAGDLHAQVNGCEVGAKAFVEVVERYGLEEFSIQTEHMFNAGETAMRSYLETIPDGRYTGTEWMDNNGVTEEPVRIDVAVEVEGSTVRVDYSDAPDAQLGPINSPLPGTISVSRIAIFALVGAGQTPNEGHFRPIEVVTRPGSMFHPLPPAPCFLYAWPELVATEAINHALAEVLPDSIPAGSGADFCIVAWWGVRETGIPWGDGIVSKSGMGAHANGDGWTGQTVLLAGTSLPPVEVWESKNPWLFEKLEMAPDSCGPGKYQGGFGVDTKFHILEDSIMTNTTEHTQYHPWGLQGGGSARSNGTAIKLPDMDWQTIGKLSAYPVAKGTTFELRSGGGGGFGPSTERDPEKVKEDMRGGLISREFAEAHYPQALES